MIKTLQLRCKYNKVRYKFSVIRKIFYDSGELAVSDVMEAIEYFQVYLDNLLTITKIASDHHLFKLRSVLIKLRNANMKVNAKNSFFGMEELE